MWRRRTAQDRSSAVLGLFQRGAVRGIQPCHGCRSRYTTPVSLRPDNFRLKNDDFRLNMRVFRVLCCPFVR